MVEQLPFEIDQGLKTKDDYHVRMKGYVSTIQEVDKSKILNAVVHVSKNHVAGLTMMDALDLILESKMLENKIANELNLTIESFKINTVDVIEVEEKKIIIDIDPSLESQKKSTGMFGKLKSIFKK